VVAGCGPLDVEVAGLERVGVGSVELIPVCRWVGGFSEIIAAINCRWAETSKPVEVSLDAESMGLYPWYKDKGIVSIGFTCEAGRADCLYLGPFRDAVGTIDPELFAQIESLLI
jgi:hypothetical protein